MAHFFQILERIDTLDFPISDSDYTKAIADTYIRGESSSSTSVQSFGRHSEIIPAYNMSTVRVKWIDNAKIKFPIYFITLNRAKVLESVTADIFNGNMFKANQYVTYPSMLII